MDLNKSKNSSYISGFSDFMWCSPQPVREIICVPKQYLKKLGRQV